MRKNDLYCKHRRWKMCTYRTLICLLSAFLMFPMYAESQQVSDDGGKIVTIKGTVKDKQGNPLPGVTVFLKGTTLGVASDVDGNFSLSLPQQKDIVLMFSFIGMKPKEVKYTNQKTIDVILEEDTEDLDEVVVTGYTNMRKESYTGTVTAVKGEDLQKVANSNPIAALQVFDPSLRILENNEMGSNPNAIPEFYVRGQSSIDNFELSDASETALRSNPNLPIFILDGMETTVERIYDMDMTRIKSMTILKDAAATAIYGSRASNGVIVVETVAPMAGKFHVSYNLTGSITAPDLTSYDYMSAEEKLQAEILAGYYSIEGKTNESAFRTVFKELWGKQYNIDCGVNTDWLARPLRVGYNHKHSVSIDGGNENIRYAINLNYASTKGVMKGDYRNVMGVSFRTDYRAQKLNVINQITYNKTLSKNSPYGSFSQYVNQLPYNRLYDSYGQYLQKFSIWHSGSQYVNPMYEATMVNNYSKSASESIGDNLTINYFPNQNLHLRATFGINKSMSKSDSFTDPASTTQSGTAAQKGALSLTNSDSYNWSTNFEAVYNKVLGEYNYVTFAVGVEMRENKASSSSESYRGIPNGEFSSPLFANEITDKPSYSDSHTRSSGLFARLNLSHKDIYLLDGSLRLDGSSEFGTDNKYAPFWALGTGVNLHKYAFLQDNAVIDRLKFTFTFGQTGKMNFPAHAAKTMYQITLNEWYVDGIGMYLKALGNEDLKWELQDSYDFGLQTTLLKGLLDVKLGYYYKLTKDMLTTVSVPSSFGFSSYYDNVGQVLNTGFEFALNSHIIKKENLFLSIYVNGAHNKNEIKKISNSLRDYNKKIDDYYSAYESTTGQRKEEASKAFTKYVEGGSTTSIFGMKSLGIDPSSGDEIYVRTDGSITTEWESQEQQILGNTLPELQGAFGFNFQWKDWSVFASFMYEWGGEALNNTLITRVESVDIYNYNADRRVLSDRWQKIGDVTQFKDIADRTYYSRPSSRFLQKNNNVEFNSLSISYTKRDGWVKNLGLNQVKFTLTTNDLVYMSTIKRERGTSYPFARTFDFSLGVIF